MRKIDFLLDKYAQSHQNHTNKLIHWICIPVILFTITGLMTMIPFPGTDKHWILNWSGLVIIFVSIYYASVSFSIMLGFLPVFIFFLFLNSAFRSYFESMGISYFVILVTAFVIAWIGQFVGHHIEGKRPSFLDDLQFLLIGPAWLLHFIYKAVGLPY